MGNGGVKALSYSVRPRAVLKHLAELGVALAVLTLVPAGAGLLFGEHRLAIWYFAVALGLFAVCAPALRMHAPGALQTNEALVISALAFAGASLLMVPPMIGSGLAPVDAWFEAVSGVTSTGLTTTRGLSDMPQTFLFARAWMEWYGGLGIVVLSVALVIGPGAAARHLSGAGGEIEHTAESARAHARRVLAVYLLLTLAGTAVVWALWGDARNAVLHTLTAISTGGFTAFDDSLQGVRLPVQAALMALSFLGAIALPVYYRSFRGGGLGALRSIEVVGLAVICVLTTLLLGLTMAWAGRPWPEILHHAPMIGLSAQTTAGFTTLPLAELDSGSKLVLILSMFVGGDIGSTAGGVKILRLLILLRMTQLLVLRTRMPSHAVVEPRLSGQRLPGDEVQRALLLILLYAAVTVAAWMAFLVAGHAPIDALFEVVSAVATCGLTTGISSPDLEPGLKLVLTLVMLFGRLEILALLVVLYPGTWLGKRAQS
ncbi:MAG: potassium transporter TrkG [Chromatiales bacterium]|jgi:trk system potassium uptake protein TrkH